MKKHCVVHATKAVLVATFLPAQTQPYMSFIRDGREEADAASLAPHEKTVLEMNLGGPGARALGNQSRLKLFKNKEYFDMRCNHLAFLSSILQE